jgi:hypothetical protein
MLGVGAMEKKMILRTALGVLASLCAIVTALCAQEALTPTAMFKGVRVNPIFRNPSHDGRWNCVAATLRHDYTHVIAGATANQSVFFRS